MRIEIRGTQGAVLRGMDADGIGCASAVQGSLREVLSGTIDAPTIHKCAARCGGDGAEVVRVREIHVTNIRVQNIDVSYERIVDVDVGNEPMAAREPGEEWLTPAQREPAYGKAESKTPAATEESDERRSVDRGTQKRSRAPTPGPANERPPSIVVGSKTPRSVIDPGPAPGSDPVPVAVAIGCPVGRHIGRIPHVPIFRLVPPSTVVIEIVVARHIPGNIVSGSRPVFFHVPLLSPFVKPIGTGPVNDVVSRILCPVKLCLLAGMHLVRCSVAADFSYAANHGNARRVARFAHIDAKSAGFLNIENHIRSIDFVDITLPQFPQAEIDRALRDADLGNAFVKIQEGNRRHAAKMKGCFAGLQFGAGFFVHPKLVTDGQRAVTGRGSPVAFPAGLQGNRSFNDADACHTSRWVLVLVLIGARLWRKEKQKTGNTKQKPALASAAPCDGLHDESPVLGRDARLARDQEKSFRWKPNTFGFHSVKPQAGKEVALSTLDRGF